MPRYTISIKPTSWCKNGFNDFETLKSAVYKRKGYV